CGANLAGAEGNAGAGLLGFTPNGCQLVAHRIPRATQVPAGDERIAHGLGHDGVDTGGVGPGEGHVRRLSGRHRPVYALDGRGQERGVDVGVDDERRGTHRPAISWTRPYATGSSAVRYRP